MRLPGQLKDTTLGDLLGALFREKADGVLELLDAQGASHRIELSQGQVMQVDSQFDAPLLGELLNVPPGENTSAEVRYGEELLRRGLVNQQQLSSALHQQNICRLEKLFSLKNANIRFRTPKPRPDDPTASPALSPEEVLHGRPRGNPRETMRQPQILRRDGALRVLGLPPRSDQEEIRRAFRSLAAQHHPDRHPEANSYERTRLRLRFAEISRAYHLLTN
jgi:hypothetical protein